jgi:hypothetical protein
MSQLSYWTQIPNLSRFGIRKFRRKIPSESCLNFKRLQTFWEKSHKFIKILTPRDLHEYEFKLAHLFAKLGSSFTSVKQDLI